MNKKDLLKEELKRHMQLLEYTFYMEDVPNDTDNLLLDVGLTEQDPVGEEPEVTVDDPFGADEVAGEEEIAVDTEELGGEEEIEVDPFAGEEEGMEVEDEFVDDTMDTGGEETVEVDVTDIVDKTEETKEEVAGITAKMDELLGKLGELETQVSGMDKVINKIDELEQEIEKRNPTPIEQLEMRSMDSFPYSISLTDFWSEQEGYEINPPPEEEEYNITQQDVDDYSATDIERSFDYDSNDEEN
tara:strand:- start:68 stop:799 length:732 start_codon:yes stop_codon:yes gene_type:complete